MATLLRGAGPILDNDRLTETFLQPLPDHAGEKVGVPPAGKPTRMRIGRDG